MKLTEAAPTGRWKVSGVSLSGECEDVRFLGERRWWGGGWNIVGSAELVIPESMILYISELGMDHGFWRDMDVGIEDIDGKNDHSRHGFDGRHFVFCNVPGLLRLVVGNETIRAFRRASNEHPIVLYVRDRIVKTKSTHDADDETAIARHVAVHRALAADHAALIASWQTRLASASGRGNTTWPLAGQINSRVGTLLVGATWEMPPESRDGAEWYQSYHSLRTDVTASGDRSKPRWTLVETEPGKRPTHKIGARMFTLSGTPNMPIDRFARLVEDSELAMLAFGSSLRIALPGLATAKQLVASRALVETLLHAQQTSESPYR